ncbi:MAG: hypothetical protein ACI8RD_013810 [Bacillariaceae sp.]|jgi:hypothetical protein
MIWAAIDDVMDCKISKLNCKIYDIFWGESCFVALNGVEEKSLWCAQLVFDVE